MTSIVHDFCVANAIPAQSDIAAMTEAYRAGHSWDRIRTDFHRGRETCMQMLQEAGVYVPGEPTPHERKKAGKRAVKRAEVERLFRETDMSLRAIRDAVNVGGTTLYEMLTELGLEGVPRRGRWAVIYNGPRCRRCEIPTNDGEQLMDVSKRFGIFDDCVLGIKRLELYEHGELRNKTLEAIIATELDMAQVAKVYARRKRMALEFEVAQDRA